MNKEKRLWKYALNYKKIIIAALLMLTISVAADLAGPFVAKKMIDEHILGIESKWFETEKGSLTAEYKGQYFKREKYFEPGEQKGKEVRVLQVGRKFVFVEDSIDFDGKRTYQNGILGIKGKEDIKTYKAAPLEGDH
ncbi:MAG TPA: multidrug ABC transporter permease, partial [Pseudoneobacillus sp.]|nr:multidrug ABC transporter permease [Pseudoneobacillus sp.]